MTSRDSISKRTHRRHLDAAGASREDDAIQQPTDEQESAKDVTKDSASQRAASPMARVVNTVASAIGLHSEDPDTAALRTELDRAKATLAATSTKNIEQAKLAEELAQVRKQLQNSKRESARIQQVLGKGEQVIVSDGSETEEEVETTKTIPRSHEPPRARRAIAADNKSDETTNYGQNPRDDDDEELDYTTTQLNRRRNATRQEAPQRRHGYPVGSFAAITLRHSDDGDVLKLRGVWETNGFRTDDGDLLTIPPRLPWLITAVVGDDELSNTAAATDRPSAKAPVHDLTYWGNVHPFLDCQENLRAIYQGLLARLHNPAPQTASHRAVAMFVKWAQETTDKPVDNDSLGKLLYDEVVLRILCHERHIDERAARALLESRTAKAISPLHSAIAELAAKQGTHSKTRRYAVELPRRGGGPTLALSGAASTTFTRQCRSCRADVPLPTSWAEHAKVCPRH